MSAEAFFDRGWLLFEQDPALLDWLKIAGPAALATRYDPKMIRDWLLCEGTWFVGVNALANDASGAVEGSGPLTAHALEFARSELDFPPIGDKPPASSRSASANLSMIFSPEF